jgi:hypothetical protein
MKTERKINILSRFFRVVALLQAIETAWSGMSRWIASPFSEPVLPKMSMIFVNSSLSTQIPSLNEMAGSLKAIGFLDYFTPLIARVLIYVFLALLFTEYTKGNIFSEKALRLIRNIGCLVLAGTLLSLIYSFITYFLLPDQFPIIKRKLQGIMIYGPIGYSLRFITGGIFIIFISWIMNMGKKLEDEQKYTV